MEIDSTINTILEKIISISWKEKLTNQNQRILICKGAVAYLATCVDPVFLCDRIDSGRKISHGPQAN